MAQSELFRPFVAALSARTSLTGAEQNALLQLPGAVEHVPPRTDFVKQGSDQYTACLLVDGIAARIGETQWGGRQITQFFIRGDTPDLHSLMEPRASAALYAVTECLVVHVYHEHLRKLMLAHPAIFEAFWRNTVCDAAISAEWVVNVGRRQAKARVAHLICEMAMRYNRARANEFEFSFPVSQIHLADATGLSSVHTNRAIQALRRERLLDMRQGVVVVKDWASLKTAGDFDAGYLHLDPPRRVTSLGGGYGEPAANWQGA